VAADHEAEVAPGLPALLHPAAEADRVERLAVRGQQNQKRALRDPALHLLLVAQLDELGPGMSGEQLLVVLDVVGERRPETPNG
jgi:hypothetical protein